MLADENLYQEGGGSPMRDDQGSSIFLNHYMVLSEKNIGKSATAIPAPLVGSQTTTGTAVNFTTMVFNYHGMTDHRMRGKLIPQEKQRGWNLELYV